MLSLAERLLWKSTRIALILWGLMNGLGLSLAGEVQRVKRRISRRVPRVSGSFGA